MPGPNYWLEFSDLLPRTWSKIGHPVPVPGGYVFIVSMPATGWLAALGGQRRMYPVTRYDAATRSLTPVLSAIDRVVTYTNSTEARAALPVIAHKIESEDD